MKIIKLPQDANTSNINSILNNIPETQQINTNTIKTTVGSTYQIYYKLNLINNREVSVTKLYRTNDIIQIALAISLSLFIIGLIHNASIVNNLGTLEYIIEIISTLVIIGLYIITEQLLPYKYFKDTIIKEGMTQNDR